MTKRHHVSFEAQKSVKEPVIVGFRKRDGTKVSFPAHKIEKEEVLVNFMVKNK